MIKTITFHCKHCNTYETIPYKEWNVINVGLYCPRCLVKNKRRKMKKVKDEGK